MNKEMITEMLARATKDKRAMRALKGLAVRVQMFELASNLREIEKTNFPETREEEAEKSIAKKLSGLFTMFDLTVPEETSWVFYQAMLLFREKGEQINLEDASKVRARAKQLFDSE